MELEEIETMQRKLKDARVIQKQIETLLNTLKGIDTTEFINLTFQKQGKEVKPSGNWGTSLKDRPELVEKVISIVKEHLEGKLSTLQEELKNL